MKMSSSMYFAVFLVSTLLVGCNRGRIQASGTLTVQSGHRFIVNDAIGGQVELTSGQVELNYQDRGYTRSTSLVVLRNTDTSQGAVIEIPTTTFSTDTNFSVLGSSIHQNYNLRANAEIEHMARWEGQTTESCTAPGVCNHPDTCTRTVTDSQGRTSTETYSCTTYGFYFACPGDRDIWAEFHRYRNHFYLHFIETRGNEEAATYHGVQPPFVTTRKLRELSSCRT